MELLMTAALLRSRNYFVLSFVILVSCDIHWDWNSADVFHCSVTFVTTLYYQHLYASEYKSQCLCACAHSVGSSDASYQQTISFDAW